MKRSYTLITGASAGLGREFAVQCSRMQRNLILIALPGSSIHKMTYELMQRYHNHICVFEFDLANHTEFDENIQRILEQYSIDFLINNAGMGGTAPILSCPVQIMDKIIQLNIRCTALLTRRLIPSLMEHPKSYILNISSMAAFSPIAYKTVYPASKAFISSYSLGLREELRGKGISVSVAYPGPMMTNSNTSQRILLQGFKARMGLFSATDLANEILKQALHGKAIIVCGLLNRINQKLMHLIPITVKTKLISLGIKQELPLTN